MSLSRSATTVIPRLRRGRLCRRRQYFLGPLRGFDPEPAPAKAGAATPVPTGDDPGDAPSRHRRGCEPRRRPGLLGWTAPRHLVPELVVVSPSKTGAVHDPV